MGERFRVRRPFFDAPAPPVESIMCEGLSLGAGPPARAFWKVLFHITDLIKNNSVLELGAAGGFWRLSAGARGRRSWTARVQKSIVFLIPFGIMMQKVLVF